MTSLEPYLDSLKKILPEICGDKNLVLHVPQIFKSLSTIHRMRQRGQVPPHFHIEPNYYYLKDDILNWLRSSYQNRASATPCNRQDQLLDTPPTQAQRQAEHQAILDEPDDDQYQALLLNDFEVMRACELGESSCRKRS